MPIFTTILLSDSMNHHQIWYCHRWYVWGYNWVVNFVSIIFNHKSGGSGTQKWFIFAVLMCVIQLCKLSTLYFLFSSFQTLTIMYLYYLDLNLIFTSHFYQIFTLQGDQKLLYQELFIAIFLNFIWIMFSRIIWHIIMWH